MGEGQQEAPGGEGSWAHTAQPTGQPQGPSPGSTPQGVAYPHVQPSIGPEASERLGQEARGPRGGGSRHAQRLLRAAVPCAEGLSLTWAEKSGWHLPFQVPSKDLGLVWLPASCHWGETAQVCVRRAVFLDPFYCMTAL